SLSTTVVFGTTNQPPGSYNVAGSLQFGTQTACQSETSFTITSSDAQGTALTGSITANPSSIPQGQTAALSYQIKNAGNVDLPSLNLKVLVVSSGMGTQVQTLTDQTSLVRGASYSNSKTFNSAGARPGDYLVILQGESSGKTQTVAANSLKIAV